MRPVLHGDVTSAARVLLTRAADLRRPLCDKMIAEAAAADIHRQQTGKLHPLWGNGSLMAAARTRRLADEPTFDDVDYCSCVEIVLQSLIERALVNLGA